MASGRRICCGGRRLASDQHRGECPPAFFRGDQPGPERGAPGGGPNRGCRRGERDWEGQHTCHPQREQPPRASGRQLIGPSLLCGARATFRPPLKRRREVRRRALRATAPTRPCLCRSSCGGWQCEESGQTAGGGSRCAPARLGPRLPRRDRSPDRGWGRYLANGAPA